jgi:hypothetical protein
MISHYELSNNYNAEDFLKEFFPPNDYKISKDELEDKIAVKLGRSNTDDKEELLLKFIKENENNFFIRRRRLNEEYFVYFFPNGLLNPNIDILGDTAFKILIKEREFYEPFLRALNEYLPKELILEEALITDLKNEDTEINFEATSTHIRFDAFFGDSRRKKFMDIEVQKKEEKGISERWQYYGGAILYKQLAKKKEYEKLIGHKHYIIALQNFKNPQTNNRWLEIVMNKTIDNKISILNITNYVLIYLVDFKLKEKELKTNLEHWIYMFKNYKLTRFQISRLPEEILAAYYKIYEIGRNAEASFLIEKKQIDLLNIISHARNEGRIEGRIEGERNVLEAVRQEDEELYNSLLENENLKLNISDDERLIQKKRAKIEPNSILFGEYFDRNRIVNVKLIYQNHLQHVDKIVPTLINLFKDLKISKIGYFNSKFYFNNF